MARITPAELNMHDPNTYDIYDLLTNGYVKYKDASSKRSETEATRRDSRPKLKVKGY